MDGTARGQSSAEQSEGQRPRGPERSSAREEERSFAHARELRPWQRFDVRTAALFGVPVLALLAVLSVARYRIASDAELSVLQSRLRGLSTSLARTIDRAALAELHDEGDHGSPPHRAIVARCAEVGSSEPDVASIYVVRRTDRQGMVRFASDWVRSGTAARVGQLYDATRTDRMLLAFDGPQVESRVYADEWGRNLSAYAPIRDGSGAVVAVLGVDIHAERLEAREREVLASTAASFAVALALLAGLGALVGRGVRRPIQRVIETTEALATGNLAIRASLERTDELGILARRVDRMADALAEKERLRAAFGRYVSEDVAARVLASKGALGPRERIATVLFADVRRYSTISERLSPHEAVELLNEVFAVLTDAVDAHGGCVVELLGDAILAVFGAPDDAPDHAERAVRCARAMVEGMQGLDERLRARGLAARWEAAGVAKLSLRIGAQSGRVVAGTLGARRARYAVLGPAVVGAQALEAKNEALGTTILLGQELVERLPPELAARARLRDDSEPRAYALSE